MIDRLNRILSLSKKTGDTVIIHDPTEAHDLVVVPFDQYEEMVSSEHHTQIDYDEAILEEMSERELIDKINRDIAIWRSYQELNLRDRQAAILEDQLAEEPLSDPFEEDFSHRTDWHRVSDLMSEKRLSKLKEKVSVESSVEESVDPIHTYVPVEEEVLAPSFIRDPLLTEEAAPVPAQDSVSEAIFEDETELSDEDNPVFLEEPTT